MRLIHYIFLFRLFTGLFVAVLIFISLPPSASQSQTNLLEEIEKQILEKQQKITELQQQINTYRDLIKNKKAEESSLKNQIDILNSQIAKLEMEIRLTQSQISETDLKINDAQIKINSEENNLTKQKEFLGELLRQIHETDQENLLNIVLKNNNFSDFLNQIQYAENLQKMAQEKVETIKFLKLQLEKTKDNLTTQKELLENFQNKLGSQQIILDGQKDQKQEVLKKTKGEERRYQTFLNDIIAKQTIFFKEVLDLEKQILAAKNYLIRVRADQIPPVGAPLFKMPIDDYILTQGYGMTNFAKKGAYGGAIHNGADITSGLGTPIKAAAAGKILVRGYNKGWGNWIAIVHPELYNLVTLYGHMQYPSGLPNGSEVTAETIIGYEGNTGFSTGPHLHLSVYYDFFTFNKNGELYFNYHETLNPLNYIK